MAANTKNDLKRDEIKYIRDRAKAIYPKGTECAICETTESLEFHHYLSLSLLWEAFKKANAIIITSVDDIMFHREAFISEHEKELYEDAVTLCLEHHQKLHSVYGAKPALYTAPKQKRWVQIQKDKLK